MIQNAFQFFASLYHNQYPPQLEMCFILRQEGFPAGNTQTILTERRQVEDKTQKNRTSGYTAGHDRPDSTDLILL